MSKKHKVRGKHHVGMSIVVSTPMSRGEYNFYRGWKLPENENGLDEGYLVEYVGLNHENWLPKDVFDRAYTPTGDIHDLAGYQQRVVAELALVSENVHKLTAFTASAAFRQLDDTVKSQLNYQLTCMASYQLSLQDRVADFQPLPVAATSLEFSEAEHESA